MDEKPKAKKIYDKKAAKPKIEYYCAYQERSQQEVRDKLYDMGLHKSDVEELISELIQTNFINEERFAMIFARGKLRMKHWGKIKIKQHLKIKKVSDYCIKKALNSLDHDEYLEIIQKEIEKKSKLIKAKNPYIAKQKVQLYLQSRGFELDIIQDLLKNT